MIDKLNRKLKQLLLNRWIIAFLIIPFIKPASEITGKFDTVFDLIKIANCFLIIYAYAINFKKISKILIGIILLQFSFVFSQYFWRYRYNRLTIVLIIISI